MSQAVRYFVSGASGFVGRQVCAALIARGHVVCAMTRRPDPRLLSSGVEVVVGDLWETERLIEALAGVSHVIHCAGNARFGDGAHYERENVGLTQHLLQAVQQAAPSLQRFVLVSTIGAVDREAADRCLAPLTESSVSNPTSDYGRSKLRCEQIVRGFGLPYAIVRPAMVIGPTMRYDSHFAVFARHAMSNALFARIDWPGRFSVIHVDDLASALVLVAEHEKAQGETYFCAGEMVRLGDFFSWCRPDVHRVGLARASRILLRANASLPFSLKTLLSSTLIASDDALRSLGWSPTYSGKAALIGVMDRERARLDPTLCPGGQTVITGAASGLGRAMVAYLSPRRAHLLLLDRDAEGLKRVLSEYKNCTAVTLDLSEQSEIEALVQGDLWRSHPVREVYACAGIGRRGTMQEISLADHRKMFEINVLARIALAKAALPSMLRDGFGRVVFISSSTAFQSLPYMATYAATNGALLAVGEAWSAELTDGSVQLLTACPGGMQTNFQARSGVKEVEGEQLMHPDEVVRQIFVGLHRRKSAVLISSRTVAMAFVARLLPRQISVSLWARLMQRMR